MGVKRLDANKRLQDRAKGVLSESDGDVEGLQR